MSAGAVADRLRIGISACLLGERVRYDGGHKRQSLIARLDEAIEELEWIRVCPEVEIGLGTPRPPMILRRSERGVRLWTPSTDTDRTEAMERHAARKLEELAAAGVCGYVLKSRSPSCGLGSVPIHDPGGERRVDRGDGLFAGALRRRFPGMPVVEETEVTEREPLRRFIDAARRYRDAVTESRRRSS